MRGWGLADLIVLCRHTRSSRIRTKKGEAAGVERRRQLGVGVLNRTVSPLFLSSVPPKKDYIFK